MHGQEILVTSATGKLATGAMATLSGSAIPGSLSPAALSAAQAPPVIVSLRLDQDRVALGSQTLLRAFAQIVPGAMPNADQIFSWNVDLLVLDGAVARLDPEGLRREASDRDPATSSGGTPDSADLRGIRDTFLNLPAAGRTEAVELFSVPIMTIESGVARYRLRPGGRGVGFDADFLVLPLDDGPFREGADYSNAYAELSVLVQGAEPPRLTIQVLPGNKARLELETAAAGPGVFAVEVADSLGSAASWTPLSGGQWEGERFSVEVPLSNSQRFFRARQL